MIYSSPFFLQLSSPLHFPRATVTASSTRWRMTTEAPKSSQQHGPLWVSRVFFLHSGYTASSRQKGCFGGTITSLHSHGRVLQESTEITDEMWLLTIIGVDVVDAPHVHNPQHGQHFQRIWKACSVYTSRKLANHWSHWQFDGHILNICRRMEQDGLRHNSVASDARAHQDFPVVYHLYHQHLHGPQRRLHVD